MAASASWITDPAMARGARVPSAMYARSAKTSDAVARSASSAAFRSSDAAGASMMRPGSTARTARAIAAATSASTHATLFKAPWGLQCVTATSWPRDRARPATPSSAPVCDATKVSISSRAMGMTRRPKPGLSA